MSQFGIFDRTIGLLERVLDLRLQNQQVISSNIANVDTPGYAPARLEFETDLRQALEGRTPGPQATHPGHIPLSGGPGEGRVIRTPDRSGIGDGNGVDLDQEMISLAENQILYETATQMISKKLGLLKYIAQDGR